MAYIIKEEEKAEKLAAFYNSDKGKKASEVAKRLKDFPIFSVIVDYEGNIYLLRKVERQGTAENVVMYEVRRRSEKKNYKYLVSQIDSKSEEEFSRMVKYYYFPDDSKYDYLLKKFIFSEKLPTDWQKNAR